MTLLEKLQQDVIFSMKAGDSVTRDALRGFITSLKNESISKMATLSSEQEIEVLMRSAKRLKEAIAESEKFNRIDLVEKNKHELELLIKYLPKQATDEEIEIKARELIAELGVSDANKLMSPLMKEFKGKADGTRVKAILEKLLT